ncbi:NAD(P)-binding protein [Pisolithus sp. B1]|nr:NAD(P)-binding protein [Pisolithus sp. B1]
MASVLGFFKRIHALFIDPPAVTKASDNGSPLKIGILGAANIAPNALIYPARSHPEVEVFAFHGIKKWYGGQDGYQELLNDPAIDAIYNPLPNGLHYEWTMKALAAGKHVLEKPSGDTAEESRLMFEFADRKGLVLLEAFHYRFHPAIQRVKEIIDSGELGSIKEVHASLGFPKGFVPDGDIRLNYSLGGGALMDAGCYTLNCVRYLASGNPTAVTSTTALRYPKDPRIDTATSAHLLFPPSIPNGSPVKASINCDMSLPNWFWFIPRLPVISARVVCDQGTVEVFNYVVPMIYHYITVSPHVGKKRTEKAYAFISSESTKGEPWWSTYRYQLEAFVDKVRGRTPQTWVSSEDSIANMLWIEKIYEQVRAN